MLAWVACCALLAAAPVLGRACTDEQLNRAQMGFRDCMEDKKSVILNMEPEEVADVQGTICQGLQDMSSGCQGAVAEFALCNGRERVDHLVAIHINAFTEVLSTFHRGVNIKGCPVFQTPPPTIVSRGEEEARPEPEYVTGAAMAHLSSPALLLLLACWRL